MKLLFCHRSIRKGGIATGLKQRLNYLSENTNYEIHVLSELSNNPETIKQFDTKIKFHVLDIQHLTNKKRIPILGYFRLIEEVKKEYQKFIDDMQPDFITGFGYGYNQEIIPYIKTSAIKVIELRGSYASRKNLNKKTDYIDFFKKDLRNLHNKYHYSIMLTQEDLEDRTYLKNKKLQINNSFKKVDDIKPFAERENIIIAVGTLTQNKNFIDLIKAAKLIKESLNNWKIHIYGEGVEDKFLNQKIKEYNLENIIELKGFKNNLHDSFNNSKILVSTSLSEGMPRNLLEAFSYKTPIISYNCKCGPKEIIRNGINGYLIDFNVNQLADRIVELVSNPDQLRVFSSNTWIDKEKFDFENTMKQWVDFYEQVAQDKTNSINT
ncbi:glycosyltransferase [Weeksellaceae bacterium KMM 9713]|uniref:Glycosyltransferase n=1 Tax=Profundicola chukchiensis TaxID=2961959 RepID=A0A9X4MXW0_9FLAO|nr:glycosyltransferase [Profundicola chukchiensis]MDG4944792.1 glycosyltransferase [Profundicola chukchiensis]